MKIKLVRLVRMPEKVKIKRLKAKRIKFIRVKEVKPIYVRYITIG
jgi:hypothetical protein